MKAATPVKSEAEKALAATWAKTKDALPGKGSVAARREAAFEAFAAAGLPNRRVEEWKYTDLRNLMREAKPLAPPVGAAGLVRAQGAGRVFAAVGVRRLVLIDGQFVSELSDLADLEPGLSIGSLAEALAANDADVVARLGAKSPADKDVAFALNTAFMGDGLVIAVAPGMQIARPIHLVHCYTGEEAAAVFTRSLVTLGGGAGLTLLESHEGPNGIDYQVDNALDIVIGDGARLERVKVGAEGDAALHVSTTVVVLGREVEFRDLLFTTGGAVTRNQVFVRCDGPGTTLTLDGASLLKGRQHSDATLVVDHAIGGCKSRETFKAVLDGESRSVFQGKTVVRPDAQKTDGKMASHALLLSNDAEADHKPELEIFADDVVCGHGATAGALDEDLKFYLMARGIPEREAETLLIQSFVGEVIDQVADESVRDALTEATTAWLDAREQVELR